MSIKSNRINTNDVDAVVSYWLFDFMTRVAVRNPHGVNFIHASYDILLLGLPIIFVCRYYWQGALFAIRTAWISSTLRATFCYCLVDNFCIPVLLTRVAVRNPHGVNFIQASCDILLLALSIIFAYRYYWQWSLFAIRTAWTSSTLRATFCYSPCR